MKTYLFIIKFFGIIILLFSIPSQAQQQFGIYFGLGACKEGNSLISTRFKTGFEAGAFYPIEIAKHFDVRVLAGYKLRGFKDEVTDMYGSPDETANINYNLLTLGPDLLFPFLERKEKVYLLAGVRGNYLMSTTGSFAGVEADTQSYAEMLDRLQLEISGGIGCEMQSGLILEAIISGNCLNKGNKNVESDFKAYDLYFGVTVGYQIPLRSSQK